MNYYFAPMEGITGYPFRNTFQKYFPGADRYYSPFLVANQTFHFKKKELRDVSPDNNDTIRLIPQVLASQADQFVWAAQKIGALGYREINLNLGCPSATVVTRHKGAGMLEEPDRLDRFFDEAFRELEKSGSADNEAPAISLKTRIGFSKIEESRKLTEIFNRYPFSEIIIHPRLREEYYNGTPHRDVFAQMMKNLNVPVCYNGDINSVNDMAELINAIPNLNAVMIGRGALRDPWLFQELRTTGQESSGSDNALSQEKKLLLKEFLDELFDEYSREMYGDIQVMFKMKELWSYLKDLFSGSEKTMKKLRKAKSRADYEAFLSEIF